MLGGIDELVMLKSLLGLLVHFVLFFLFCSSRFTASRELVREVTAQSFKSISASNQNVLPTNPI